MSFIGTHWWLWLILLVIFGGYAIYNQLKRMKGMLGGGKNNPFSSFFSNLGPLVFAGFMSLAAGSLLLISIIVNLLDYWSK